MNVIKLVVVVLGISISNLALASKAVIVSDASIVDDDNYGIVIKAVDGEIRNRSQMRLDEGTYTLVLQTTKEPYGNGEPTMQGVSFEVAACTKYRISAQHKNRFSEDWELQIHEVTTIPGCNAEENTVSS
ncbi:hypothetical protein [uncultured Umboniibacter sp.]|uniref:hypothetical protein n=1 Tax=uncultured Umboniibacter sp. TaxID=1798917 RepID=UPI0026036059|nr:hypothetical protein [uncultured Umboniibacter sp.]